VIRTYSSKSKERGESLKGKAGANLFNWNMRYPDAKDFDGMILWGGSMAGPTAVPGEYMVTLKIGDQEQTQSFRILKDPRSESSIADLQAQFDFVKEVNEKITEAHEAIIDIREIKSQMSEFSDRLEKDEAMDPIRDKAKEITKSISKVEEALYQTKNRSNQDPLNFPIRLTNKLAGVKSLSSMGNYRPTKQSYTVRDELTKAIDAELAKFKMVKDKDLQEFNRMVKEKGVNAIILKESGKKDS
jgi:hypothetical protein